MKCTEKKSGSSGRKIRILASSKFRTHAVEWGDMTDPYDECGDEFESGENHLGEEGCLFPGECCMAAAFHYKSECHTPEMMEWSTFKNSAASCGT
jgi:hypothetical protein